MNVGQPALFSNVQVWGKPTVKWRNSGVVLVAIDINATRNPGLMHPAHV